MERSAIVVEAVRRKRRDCAVSYLGTGEAWTFRTYNLVVRHEHWTGLHLMTL